MASFNINPVVKVTEDGTEYQADITEMGLYLGLLGPDMQFKMTEGSTLGSLGVGIGTLRLDYGNNYTNLINWLTSNNLYIYFYNSDSGNVINSYATLPDFMDEKLNVDESKIIMYASNTTNIANVSSLKEGILTTRDSDVLTVSPRVGNTYNFPIGQGTGQFNSFCVSLCDLTKLKTSGSANVYTPDSVFYIGRTFAVDNLESTSGYNPCSVISYIRNNVEGITGENELLLKFSDKVGLFIYNMLTGSLTQYTGSYTGYMTPWGSNMVKIDNIYYGLTNTTTTEGDSTYTSCYVFSYNPLTGEQKLGSTSFTVNEKTSLLKYDNKLYLNIGEGNSNQTSSSVKVNYKEVNLSSLNQTSTVLTVTVPDYLTTYQTWYIENYDDTIFILHDTKNCNSFLFTDITDIENTITRALFVGNGLPLVYNTNQVLYASITRFGFYNDTNTYSSSNERSYNFLRTTDYTGHKFMLCSDNATPMLTFTGFGKTYDKTENTDFTTTYYIEAQKGVMENATV